ncbi:methyltransferase domain-containing protein [Candidatus Parcubacteria bacterium]|nr:methyltransferase domain-containing protein [Candidatus Parcubacteria bacterium]
MDQAPDVAGMEVVKGFLNPNQLVDDFGITEGMQIADFGSGTGHIAILMAHKVGETGAVTALDIMEDKLDSVRVRAKADNLNNIATVRANLEVMGSTGLADASQDMVTVINILFQSPQKEEIIKEAYRVIKPDGRLVLVDWKKEAGGFGPPNESRTDENIMQTIVTTAGFIYERPINAGQFHYGFIVKK